MPQRTNNIIEERFGLKGGEGKTLEAIGQVYDLTRERVRQIIDEGISKIRLKLKEYQKVYQHFNRVFKSFGDLKKEDALLSFLGGEKFQNQISFLLTLDEGFERLPEDESFFSFWTKSKDSADSAEKVIDLTLNKFQTEKKTYSLKDIFEIQKVNIEKALNKKINQDIFGTYLEISKKIQKNPENYYGLRDWLEINPRGIKDKAYLVFKKQGKPLHFTEVANYIEKLPFLSVRKAQLATVHNELIRDQRFVLVGRGLYALKEWGYEPGIVKDIILKVLKEADRPLTKKEIVEKVLKQRIVKANTVSINLQNKNAFLRDAEGKYRINKVQEA